MADLTTLDDGSPSIGDKVYLDENVRQALPRNCSVQESVIYGTAAWTRATRISVVLEDGTPKSYFLKCAAEEHGRQMIEGEYASMRELARYNESLVPVPCTHGELKEAEAPTYFFLMEFVDIDTGAPDPFVFCKQLAALHQDSKSPNGKFGFDMITCHGPHPQNTTWEDNWAFFFARLLRQFFDREINTNGPTSDGAYEAEFDKLVTHAVPALLQPLQSHGRGLKASLVHGDLWEENCGTDLLTGQPKIFDAAVFYGHNEYDLGMWRREIIRFGKSHIRQYLKHMPPSDPKEQWDDRNRLYCIKFEIAHSIGWPATAGSQREMSASPADHC